MKLNLQFVVLFIVFFGFSSSVKCQENYYTIQVKIDNLKGEKVILGHHFANDLYTDDTVKLDNQGIGRFLGNQKLKKGMYFIYLPNKKYFDFLIGDKQVFKIENDTFDFVKRFMSDGSKENQLFYDYQRYYIKKNQDVKFLRDKIKHAVSEKEKKDLQKQLMDMDKEVRGNIKQMIQLNPGLLFSTFLRATIEPEVPDFPRDEKGKIIDSLFQYKYYRAHYFDNFDFTNPDLLRTPVYEEKFKTYFEKIIPQIPDSIIPEVDMLVARARKDTLVFRYVLMTLLNSYAANPVMGMDKVFIYIAEKYYVPEAKWSARDFIEKLKAQIKEKKPTLIGNTAPDIQLVEVPAEHFVQAMDDTAVRRNPNVGSFFNISGIKAKYTILIFWETECGHCQKAMPVMHDVYEKFKDRGVKVIAVHTLGGIDGKEKWIKYINEHNYLDWINAWNPYDFSYKEKYNVQTTPAILLMDERKKIIAKQISAEQVEVILNYLFKTRNNQ